MQRKDEILAKKAKLAELRRQREEREQRQKEHGKSDSILDDSSDLKVPTPRRSTDRKDLDSFIETLVGDRPSSRGPGTSSPAGRKSRPGSTLGSVQVGSETYEQAQGATTPHTQYASTSTQTLSTGPVQTNFETPPGPQKPTPELVTYSKGVQTSEQWSPQRASISADGDSGLESEGSPSAPRSPKSSKRLSRRQRERQEELRHILKLEIEEELRAAKDSNTDGQILSAPSKFPARGLSNEELNAVTSSEDFLNFVERSSKVIEKALDQDYDLLADYALDGVEEVDEDEDEGYGSSRGKKGKRIKQVAQFYDERWSKKRMISDMGFSPKVGTLHESAFLC